jgi:uncharacterized membrane-anchored protein
MHLKITPKIDARYWTAIMIASMCGTNLGDFSLGVLEMSTEASLAMWFALFCGIMLLDRLIRRGSEAFYWLAILVVRAAATNIADFSAGPLDISYRKLSVALAVLLAIFVAWRSRVNSGKSEDLPPTDASYWLTMLIAGSLGTITGDGFGHAIHGDPSIYWKRLGIPISAAAATIALALILTVRARAILPAAMSYWIAVVAVRWWGTNLGDELAFLISLTTSLIVTGALLALTLLVWREPITRRE